MSTLESSTEQKFFAIPNIREASPASLIAIVLTMLVLTSAITTAFAIYYYPRESWVEIIGKGVLRTDAPSSPIASARDAVIQKHQDWIVGKDGKRSDPSYRGEVSRWSTGQSQEDIQVEVIRGNTQIKDINSAILSIETISVTDTPTLVFVHYDRESEKLEIVNDLVNELIKHGVKVR